MSVKKTCATLSDGLKHFKQLHNLKCNSTYRCIQPLCSQAFQNKSSFKKHFMRKHNSFKESNHTFSSNSEISTNLFTANNETPSYNLNKNINNENQSEPQQTFDLESAIKDISTGDYISESDEEKFYNLKLLLTKWNCEYLTESLVSQKITTNTLKIIKQHHIEKILKEYSNGEQIEFEHNLEKWRTEIGIPLSYQCHTATNFQSPTSSTTSTIRCISSPKLLTSRLSPYSKLNLTPRGRSPQLFDIPSLANILNNSNKGIMLTELFKQKQSFEEEHRSLLVSAIAQYYEDNNFQMTLAISHQLEHEIIDRFPSEKLEFYRIGKRGKIYNKFCNLKANIKPISKFLKSLTPLHEENGSTSLKEFGMYFYVTLQII